MKNPLTGCDAVIEVEQTPACAAQASRRSDIARPAGALPDCRRAQIGTRSSRTSGACRSKTRFASLWTFGEAMGYADEVAALGKKLRGLFPLDLPAVMYQNSGIRIQLLSFEFFRHFRKVRDCGYTAILFASRANSPDPLASAQACRPRPLSCSSNRAKDRRRSGISYKNLVLSVTAATSDPGGNRAPRPDVANRLEDLRVHRYGKIHSLYGLGKPR